MENPMPLPLELVLNVITNSLPKYPNVLLAPSHPITQTLLSFTLVCHETRRVANRYIRQYCVYLSSEARLRAFLLEIPNRPEIRNINSLFLAPFTGNTIDDLPTATWVRELFNYTCLNLKRLIIDIPLRSLYPENDHLAVRAILREGFQRLENLEELVSVRDELFLSITHHGGEPPVWRSWTKLRRLALYNVDADSYFWRNVGQMPTLETVVLTRADSLRDFNIKKEYFKYANRPLKVLLINVEEDQIRFSHLPRINWDKLDPEKKVTIMTYNVPCPFEEDDPIEICQEYVRIGAENGTIWEWEGEQIQHQPKISDIRVLTRITGPSTAED
ncbi:hypothetical protein K505DRAFT_329264 [Melanomma pulvis-pyrius CBS 109.77]|uniref:F-box domain-containing protein n=1 Tax=Melanomma pulvis-pyrius CBS 109.77 TaxID=1314802 RepID=A0A6A6WV33_9PLEO|nr:hypothetical protein K505DRAFT_329264 [Melanomma pulvis-pyrius CBS 109.77]